MARAKHGAGGGKVRIGLVGAGYVADLYLKTLANHPELELVGVMDRDQERAARFAKFHRVPLFGSLDALLDCRSLDVVVNLTNPSSHFEVSRAALEAGKHVYSEKPFAMELGQARTLVELASARGRYLAGAPCSVLGETAQTMWKALRKREIGTPRLVYAELDDGPIHQMGYRNWKSDSGTPWPYRDEFRVGCTLEHAGYYLTWLVAFFGSVSRVSSFSTCLLPHKASDMRPEDHAPDFSVACLQFESGVTARLTCSILAPHDHKLRIIGDAGILSTEECWDYRSQVHLLKRTPLRIKGEKHPRMARAVGLGARTLPLVGSDAYVTPKRGTTRMDFARGVAELASAITAKRPCRLSPAFSLHVNEVVLAIQTPPKDGATTSIESRCEAMAPMLWADG